MSELLSRLKQLERVVDDMRTKGEAVDFAGHQSSESESDSDPGNGGVSLRAEGDAASNDSSPARPCHNHSYRLHRSFGSLHLCESGALYTGNAFWTALHGEVTSLSMQLGKELDSYLLDS